VSEVEENTKALLCVDDELNILSSLKRLLRKEEYKLFTADSAKEGLEILEKESIQVVLSDQRMPEMTGVTFLQEVKKMHPSTVRVVLSGYADLGTIVDAINQGEIYRFLTKPWSDENLKADIRQCFEHYDILRENRQLFDVIQDKNQKLQEVNEHLEQQVLDRTQTLQMSQDILEQLPLPVIGISADYQVITANNAASQKFTELSLFFPGSQMDELIPEAVCELIRDSIERNACFEGSVFWEQYPIQVKIQPLISGEKNRGVIMVTY